MRRVWALVIQGFCIMVIALFVLLRLWDQGWISWAWLDPLQRWYTLGGRTMAMALAAIFWITETAVPQRQDGGLASLAMRMAWICIIVTIAMGSLLKSWGEGDIADCVWDVVVTVVLLRGVFELSHREAALTLILSIPMNQPQARTWAVLSGTEALAAFAAEFQKATGQELPENLRGEGSTYIACYGYTLEKLHWYGMDRRGGFSAAKAYYCVRARLREVEESMLNLYRTDAPVRLARDPSKDDTKIAKHN